MGVLGWVVGLVGGWRARRARTLIAGLLFACFVPRRAALQPEKPAPTSRPPTRPPPHHPPTHHSNLLTSVAPSLLLSLYHMCVLPVLVYYAAQVRAMVVLGGSGVVG